MGQTAAALKSLARAKELGLQLEAIHPLERPGLVQLQSDLQ
jgi:hypothetical protein